MLVIVLVVSFRFSKPLIKMINASFSFAVHTCGGVLFQSTILSKDTEREEWIYKAFFFFWNENTAGVLRNELYCFCRTLKFMNIRFLLNISFSQYSLIFIKRKNIWKSKSNSHIAFFSFFKAWGLKFSMFCGFCRFFFFFYTTDSRTPPNEQNSLRTAVKK